MEALMVTPIHIDELIIGKLLPYFVLGMGGMLLIGPPIAQLLVFGYAATFDLNNIPVAAYNEDRSAPSRELVARLTGSPHFHLVGHLGRDAQIAPLIDNKDALMVLHLGPRFSEYLKLGITAPVQLIIDGHNSNTAMLALGYMRTILTDFNIDWSRQHGRPGPPAALKIRPWYNANLVSRWFIVPGIVG